MFTLSLSEKELELIKKSIQHCLSTCKEGGSKSGCTDCAALESILSRLPVEP
ncbi:MAG: hypothetical protein AB7E30_05285 [Lawsonibacter sp.]